MIYILRIEYKEDLERIENLDIVRYIKEEIECISEESGYEDEFDSFTFYDLGELFLIEKEEEFPYHLPFEYCSCKHIGNTRFYAAGYLRTNEDIIEYIIPDEIITDRLREFLENEI